MTLYAHLSKVLVKEGAEVAAGEPIGIEGASGRAGNRHLHFSVHRPRWLEEILQNPGWTGRSVPFRTTVRYSDRKDPETISSLEIRWEDGFGEPYLYGVW